MASKDNVKFIEENRVIILSDNIDEATSGEIIYNLLKIEESDNTNSIGRNDYQRSPIKLYINSCGGDLYDTWSMIDIIENMSTPVYTYCTGYAFSASFLLFLAGEKRFGTRHALWMYHQCASQISGKVKDITSYAIRLNKEQKEIEEYVVQHCDIPLDNLNKSYENKEDIYMEIEDAMKYNIVTDLII